MCWEYLFRKLGFSSPVTKELAGRVNRVRGLASRTPKQSANWLRFSLSIDRFNIIQTWPASVWAHTVTTNKVT